MVYNKTVFAKVVELVDTQASGACGVIYVGSSPIFRTIEIKTCTKM